MSAKTEKILQPGKIHILSTEIIKCSLECPFNFAQDPVKKHDFQVSFDLAFNLDDSMVKADFGLKVTTISNGDDTQEAKGEFLFVYIFKIDNLSELVSTGSKKEIKVNGALGNALSSIAYSTSRGILFTHLKGTALENFILPVIDPNDLLKG